MIASEDDGVAIGALVSRLLQALQVSRLHSLDNVSLAEPVRELTAALNGHIAVHGHVSFVLFVPVTALLAIALLLWPRRRELRVTLRRQRRDWIAFAGVVGLFVLPIAINYVFNYPGEFRKYWDYSRSDEAGGHATSDIVEYMKWFWPHGPVGGRLLIALAVVGAIAFAIWDRSRDRALVTSRTDGHRHLSDPGGSGKTRRPTARGPGGRRGGTRCRPGPAPR